MGQLVNNLVTAFRRIKVPGSYRKDGSQTERTQQMIFVNESGFHAQRKTYSTENLSVNLPATAKRGFISAATGKKKVGTVAKRWCKLIFADEKHLLESLCSVSILTQAVKKFDVAFHDIKLFNMSLNGITLIYGCTSTVVRMLHSC
ncbi:hypothetical protein [Segatella sp.]|uniref:hypothetical protein n=1 Tax=Segatella sp. TaxID=2974253 RepID=UPI0030774BD1